MEQREQSQTRLSYAESRQRKAKANYVRRVRSKRRTFAQTPEKAKLDLSDFPHARPNVQARRHSLNRKVKVLEKNLKVFRKKVKVWLFATYKEDKQRGAYRSPQFIHTKRIGDYKQ